ncbi:MAG TPA: neutral/alkaline non-lysosomal ceramidase N-terminal domain-containing protein [Bryobacteraceae bacterium]|nr:neutral/alkaline non-lysosomal ceramidase N-terminal domain-containing protein [Bryobacteraceae bacterium]
MKYLSLPALFLVFAGLGLGATFRAAAVEVDITPDTPQWLMGYGPRQSTGVHDKIYHRIVALDDGRTQFYLVSSDLCLFSPGVYDDVAATLKKDLGIERKNIWWSVTHSHAAPEVGAPGFYKTLLGRSDHEWNREYANRVTNSLVDAVKSAKSKLEPARIAIGTGMSMANINRRAKDVDGRVSLGLNPDGPADRQIGVIRLERTDGRLIAAIVNYAMHGTVMSGANLLVSGDGPGTVSAYVQQKISAPVVYVNGAAGNLAPIYSVYPDPRSAHLSQFNVLLGDRILAALNSLGPPVTDVTLSADELITETRRKDGLEFPPELASYERSGSNGASAVRLPVRFLRINDTLIWAAPLELFCEIAIAVRNQSPFRNTFYFGYTNGWLGYLPTSDAFAEGGYEPKTSLFTNEAERDLLQSVITYIQGLRR